MASFGGCPCAHLPHTWMHMRTPVRAHIPHTHTMYHIPTSDTCTHIIAYTPQAHVPRRSTHTDTLLYKEENGGTKAAKMVSACTWVQSLGEKNLLDYWDLIESLPSGAPLLWSPGTPDGSRQSPEWGEHLHWSLPWACVLACGPVFPLGCSVLETRFRAACAGSGLWQFLLAAPTGPSPGRGSLWQFSIQ